jgi:hypothetical protein
MINLLKASSKKINPHKKRKVIPLMGSIKKYHADMEEIVIASKKKDAPVIPISKTSTQNKNADKNTEMK